MVPDSQSKVHQIRQSQSSTRAEKSKVTQKPFPKFFFSNTKKIEQKNPTIKNTQKLLLDSKLSPLPTNWNPAQKGGLGSSQNEVE